MTVYQVPTAKGLSVSCGNPVANRAIFDCGGIWRSFVINGTAYGSRSRAWSKDDFPNMS